MPAVRKIPQPAAISPFLPPLVRPRLAAMTALLETMQEEKGRERVAAREAELRRPAQAKNKTELDAAEGGGKTGRLCSSWLERMRGEAWLGEDAG
jgi:hypothetical protein